MERSRKYVYIFWLLYKIYILFWMYTDKSNWACDHAEFFGWPIQGYYDWQNRKKKKKLQALVNSWVYFYLFLVLNLSNSMTCLTWDLAIFSILRLVDPWPMTSRAKGRQTVKSFLKHTLKRGSFIFIPSWSRASTTAIRSFWW